MRGSQHYEQISITRLLFTLCDVYEMGADKVLPCHWQTNTLDRIDIDRAKIERQPTHTALYCLAQAANREISDVLLTP